jgi:hypothetical protein
MNKLMAHGMMFQDNEHSRVPSQDFYSHVESNYAPFVREFIDCLIVQGYVVFCFSNYESRPCIVNRRMGTVKFRFMDDYSRQTAFFPHKSNQPAPGVMIRIEQHPSEDGEPVSPIASYLHTRRFTDSIERCTMTAELSRCNPPIYTVTSTDASFDDRDLAHQGEVDGLRATIQRDNQLIRNRITVDSFKQSYNLCGMLNEHKVDTNNAAWNAKVDKSTGLCNYDAGEEPPEQEIKVLPNDSRVVAPPVAQSRADVLQFQTQAIDVACLCMGIPRTFLHGGSTNTTASQSAAANATALSVVLRYKTSVCQVLEKLYSLVYGGTAYLVFPSLQPTDIVDSLFSQGLITYNAYVEWLSERYKIPTSSFMPSKMFAREENTLPSKQQARSDSDNATTEAKVL